MFKNALAGKVIITSVTIRLKKSPDLNFEYSSLKAELSTKSISELTIKDVCDAVIKIRRSKLPDPKEIGNIGSFFKNPEIIVSQFLKLKEHHPNIPGYTISEEIVKIPAAWLIEQVGWKGKREGDAGVYEKQALVLVNHGKATGSQILHLAKKIEEDVLDTFGIRLVKEVHIYLG